MSIVRPLVDPLLDSERASMPAMEVLTGDPNEEVSPTLGASHTAEQDNLIFVCDDNGSISAPSNAISRTPNIPRQPSVANVTSLRGEQLPMCTAIVPEFIAGDWSDTNSSNDPSPSTSQSGSPSKQERHAARALHSASRDGPDTADVPGQSRHSSGQASHAPPASPLFVRTRAATLGAFTLRRPSSPIVPTVLYDSLGFIVSDDPQTIRVHQRLRKRVSSSGSDTSLGGFLSPRSTPVQAAPTEPCTVDEVHDCAWYGLAPDVRATVWYHATGGFAMQAAHDKTYNQLVELAREKYTEAERDQVEVDVPRTFGHNHPRFKTSSTDSLLPALERMLMVVLYLQDGLYWQGYNFVAGLMLLVFDDEEAAFWTFMGMLQNLLSRVFGERGPNHEIVVLDELVRQQYPVLSKHFGTIGIPLRTFTAPWIICAFATSLPPETTLRVWDLLICASTEQRYIAHLGAAYTEPTNDATARRRRSGANAASSASQSDASATRTRSASNGGRSRLDSPGTQDRPAHHSRAEDRREDRPADGIPSSASAAVQRVGSVSLPASPVPPSTDPAKASAPSPPEVVSKLARRALTMPPDARNYGSLRTGQRAAADGREDAMAPPADTATNLMLLVSLTLLDMLQRDVLKCRAPDKVNRAFKRATSLLYDVEALFQAATVVCGGDRRVWRRAWPMAVQLSMIRSRAVRILDIQSVRNKKYTQIQKIVSGSGGKLRSQMRESDFVEFFRDLFRTRAAVGVEPQVNAGEESSLSASQPAVSVDDGNDGSSLEQPAEHSPQDAVGSKNWLEMLEDAMWVAEVKALFRVFDDVNAGVVNRTTFITMMQSFPHITQLFADGERDTYTSTRLRPIFDKFDKRGKGALNYHQVLDMLKHIHTCSARLLEETQGPGAAGPAEPKLLTKREDWEKDYAQMRQWEHETEALLQSCPRGVLTFEAFVRCTAVHPTIAVGVCLLRKSDVEARETAPVADSLVYADAAPQHLSQVLINLGSGPRQDFSASPSKSGMAVQHTFLGQLGASASGHFFATVTGTTYVPSNSLFESVFNYGHMEYTVQLTTEDATFENPACRHEDFLTMYANIIDEYPHETQLSAQHLHRIKEFQLPKHPLGKFSSQAVLERKNLWKAFLDTIQSADSERVQVCLCDLVKTTE
eukprot:m.996611 g.996611  ORF g.996611 m.996611 type:complete len:1150 (-) comp24020_c1_seq2:804-4253(-)